MQKIQIERISKVMIVTIANEVKRNALDISMEQPFYDSLREAEDDDAVRVVVITGAGNLAFCSGHDLTEVGRPGMKFMKPDPMSYPDRMRKPVIAAVNGHCHAAGLMLALCCDLRIASENAVFGQPGAKIGQLPAGGQIWRIAQNVHQVRAIEMMMTADPISAQQAYDWGMVNSVVPRGEALRAALQLAERVARNSPRVVRAIKEGKKILDREGRDAFDRYEEGAIRELMASADRIEGSKAFAEKRQPHF